MPWHIHYSRTGFGETVLFALLLTLGLYLLLRALRLQNSLLPAAVVLGVSLYSYRAAWVVLPPLLLALAVLYRRELGRDSVKLLPCLGVLALFALPILRHVLSDSSDRSEQVWIFNVETEKGILVLFWDYYSSYFSTDFLFVEGDNGPILRHYLPGKGMLYWFQAPLLALGIASIFIRTDRRGLVVLALLVLSPLGGALSESSPHSLRALAMTIPATLLSAMGLVLLADSATRALPRWRAEIVYAVVGVATVVAALSLYSYLERYHGDYPRLSDGYWGWQDGPQAIVRRFLETQGSYDELLMDGTFNAPGVFLSFYGGDACRKCRIGDSEAYDPSRRQLFALRPESLRRDRFEYIERGEIRMSGGQPGFVFVEIAGRR
jgi:hypothetical protein